MDLKIGNSYNYLTWQNYRFGSDSITASFRYKNYKYMIEKIANFLPNYHEFVENYINKCYTIGGSIIFPKLQGGINQRRGCSRSICDRWDLTLECIRSFYLGKTSPLYDVLESNKDFFSLFVDFKGYVDFFFLQDCVTNDYQNVKFWLGNGEFELNPLPKTIQEYLLWIENELDFVEKRNKRIQKILSTN